MSWLSDLFSTRVGSLVERVGLVADEVNLSDEQRPQFKQQIESAIQKRDATIQKAIRAQLAAREQSLLKELNQGDSYTKRARPTVVYAGLVFIGFNYVLVPIVSDIFGTRMPVFELPDQFWYGWTGIVGTWSIGRTFEKRGATGNVVKNITGSKPASSFLDDI
jgi:hypothetical protein